MKNNPLISVIIPTKNSERTIDRCLKSVTDQADSNVEIIVVDNNSQDRTKEIARVYTPHVFNHGPERSAQRNFGIRKAKGEFIVWLDSDMYMGEKSLQECIQLIKEGADMISFPSINYPPTALNLMINYERLITNEKRHKDLPRLLNKKIFKNVGYFNERRIFDEDIELIIRARKAGFKEGMIKEITLHDEVTSLSKIAKKYFYYGSKSSLIKKRKHNYEISKYYGLDLQFFRNCLKYTLKNPILFIPAISIKLIKYVSFFLGMIFGRKTEYY